MIFIYDKFLLSSNSFGRNRLSSLMNIGSEQNSSKTRKKPSSKHAKPNWIAKRLIKSIFLMIVNHVSTNHVHALIFEHRIVFRSYNLKLLQSIFVLCFGCCCFFSCSSVVFMWFVYKWCVLCCKLLDDRRQRFVSDHKFVTCLCVVFFFFPLLLVWLILHRIWLIPGINKHLVCLCVVWRFISPLPLLFSDFFVFAHCLWTHLMGNRSGGNSIDSMHALYYANIFFFWS